MRTERKPRGQDRAQEIAVFAKEAEQGVYDMFTPRSHAALMRQYMELGQFAPGDRVADLGCGSGAYTQHLQQRGVRAIGMDLCEPLVAVGKRQAPLLPLCVGDAEALPMADGRMDGVLLSGLIHHFPDPAQLARETYRVLKPGGRFVALDPNRNNPVMWLYRDRSSPWYSSCGVTPNERPVVAAQVACVFSAAGFRVRTAYISLTFRHIASASWRWALPLYNALETALFALPGLKRHRAFVITCGEKR